MHASTWHIDSTSILCRRELAAVLADAKAKAAKSANSWRNLIVFRLACCCGLRVSEIAQLEMGDVIADVERPHLRLRRGATKGGKSRTVPLWWDAGTLADLRAWKAYRVAHGAGDRDPFVCSVQAKSAWGGASAACGSAAVLVGVQDPRSGSVADADNSPRAAYVH
jgi:integrase